jgi:hypothetical protein
VSDPTKTLACVRAAPVRALRGKVFHFACVYVKHDLTLASIRVSDRDSSRVLLVNRPSGQVAYEDRLARHLIPFDGGSREGKRIAQTGNAPLVGGSRFRCELAADTERHRVVIRSAAPMAGVELRSIGLDDRPRRRTRLDQLSPEGGA